MSVIEYFCLSPLGLLVINEVQHGLLVDVVHISILLDIPSRVFQFFLANTGNSGLMFSLGLFHIVFLAVQVLIAMGELALLAIPAVAAYIIEAEGRLYIERIFPQLARVVSETACLIKAAALLEKGAQFCFLQVWLHQELIGTVGEVAMFASMAFVIEVVDAKAGFY